MTTKIVLELPENMTMSLSFKGNGKPTITYEAPVNPKAPVALSRVRRIIPTLPRLIPKEEEILQSHLCDCGDTVHRYAYEHRSLEAKLARHMRGTSCIYRRDIKGRCKLGNEKESPNKV